MYDITPALQGDDGGILGHSGDIATFVAIDPDGDPLTYSAVSAIPLPYEFTPTGTLRVVAGARAVAGTFSIQIQVADDGSPSLTDTATVNWQVVSTRSGTCDAVDDSYTVNGNAITPGQYTFDVRSNDIDSNGGSPNRLSITLVTAPEHGTATRINSGTQIRYTPSAGFVGADSFLYQVEDSGNLMRDWARVSVNVQANTLAPDVPDTLDFFSRVLTIDGAVVGTVTESSGDIDPITWTISAGVPFNVDQNGTIKVNGTRSAGTTYTFTVTASDGEFSDSTTVNVRVSKKPTFASGVQDVYIDLPRTFSAGAEIATFSYDQPDPEDAPGMPGQTQTISGPPGPISNLSVTDGGNGVVKIIANSTFNAAILNNENAYVRVYDLDGDDSTYVTFHAKDYIPPEFSDTLYVLPVLGTEAAGASIGRVQAFDFNPLSYTISVSADLTGLIDVSDTGEVTVLDPSGLATQLAANAGALSGTITVTNAASLTDTATLTLQSATAETIDDLVDNYLITWESRAKSRSQDVRAKGANVISGHYDAILGTIAEASRIHTSAQSILVAFANFIPNPVLSGTVAMAGSIAQAVANGYAAHVSGTVAQRKATALSEWQAAQNHEENNKIIQAASQKRTEWASYKTVPGRTVEQLQAWFISLQTNWPLPHPTGPSEDELRQAAGIP